jgi:eukaryotic-like serine/threonine-protein kinase
MGLGSRPGTADPTDPGADRDPRDDRDDLDDLDDLGAEAGDGSRGPRPAAKAPAVVAGAVGAVAAGAAAGGAAVAKGLGSAVGAAGGLAGAVGGRMGGLARGAADRAAERSANRAERRDTEQWEDPFVVGEKVRLSDTLEPTDEQLEPPLPLLPGTAQEPLDRDQSRLALIVIAAFVVVAAALGVWGLPKLSGIGPTSSSGAAPVVTQTVTATPGSSGGSPTATPSPTSSAAPTTNAPIAIASASQISTDAGVQAVKTTAQAYDGDPATFWRSTKWYATPAYGGIPNRQVGLLLDLGSPVNVHQVAFTLVGAADVSVYVGTQQKVDGATQIGAVSGQDGAQTVTVAGGGAASGRYVILWFTTLGPDGEGHFRAQVAEVSVS